MKKILVLLLLASCSTTVKKVEAPKVETLPEIEVTQPHSPEVLEGIEHFYTKSSLAYLQKTAAIANCVLTKSGFYEEVVKTKFTHTKKNSEEVAKDLRNIKVELKSYQTSNPWSKAIATTTASEKAVYFNTRRNPRGMKEMVNTAIHEGTHTVGYSHGDNYYNSSKALSVPYGVGSIGVKYVQECE